MDGLPVDDGVLPFDVPPNTKAARGEVGVQAGDERFVIAAGVGEKDRFAHPITFQQSLGPRQSKESCRGLLNESKPQR